MATPVKRRLAVILAYDVVGYSRLMEQDEEGTHQRVMDIMRDLVQPLLVQRQGRQVKNTGDGGLVEFDSVVEAARWALAVQRELAVRNAPEPADRRIELRVGISIGDIIIEPNDIYGEGVNIAARLQTIADVGGICVTQMVVEQLRGKLDVGFADLGEPKLKNMNRAVRVFRLVDEGLKPPAAAHPAAINRSPYISGFGGRPAIAVMPLDTFSKLLDEEYFSDGLTEDITTALANWRSFPVISRNSSFTYKGRKIEVKALDRNSVPAISSRAVCGGSDRMPA